MTQATMINHCGAREVTRDELALVHAPEPTKTWYPIAHSRVLDSVWEHLEGAGFRIEKARYSLSQNDARFFGTLDLSTAISGGVNLAVGVRNSCDKSFPIGFCCGSRVFVCDNLAFTSEIVVSKKHTRFGEERYLEGLARAVGSLNQYQEAAADWIARLSDWELPEDTANSLILQAYEKKFIGARLLPQVIEEWRKPSHEEFQPRTGWSLWNCFTEILGRTMQTTRPAEAALTTIRLQKLITPPSVIIDSTATAV